MAPGSQAAADGGAAPSRSGGKILKRRRSAAARRTTPYDRPSRTQTPTPPEESPNWLTGLVFPAKFVANGASKLLSSLWNPTSWGSPSSSSDDDSDSSEDGIEVDTEDFENPSNDVQLDQQRKGSSSGKSEALHLVEQLLMLEHYSREEGNRLTEIINSRVVDYPMREGMDAGPSKVLSRTDTDTPDIRSQAIMEAKKWLAEQKVGSSSKSDLDNGIYAFRSVMTPNITKGEPGSPVDVAISYMRARPPWASPINRNDSPTPSPLATDLIKEGTPYSSVGGNSFPSAKRDYLSAGSWSIQDEIRRLRSKATEDMLSSRRSTNFASFTLEHDTTEHSLANDKAIEAVKLNEQISSEAPKTVDEIVEVAAERGTVGITDTRTTQGDLPTKGLPSHPTALVQEQNQDLEPVEIVERQDPVSNKSHRTPTPEIKQNSRHSGEGNGSVREENSRHIDERNLDQERSDNNDRMVDDINPVEGNCELMTESTDVPNVNETEAIGVISGSQGSSNTNNPSLVQKTDGQTEKRSATRTSSRYARKGRGRGK